MLKSLGVDRVEVLDFSKDFAKMDAESYLRDIVKARYGATAVFLGYDNRLGSDTLLPTELEPIARRLALEVVIVPPASFSDMVVSSTKIRKALDQGEVELAARLLGYDYSLKGEHEAYAARCSEISAELVEIVTDIACCTVLVIGKCFNNNGNAVRAIAFVCNIFIVNVADITGSLLNTTFNGIVGHVVGFSLCDKVTELAVVVRVAAAFFYAYSDLPADLCEDLCLSAVGRLFFSFDVVPFGMT